MMCCKTNISLKTNLVLDKHLEIIVGTNVLCIIQQFRIHNTKTTIVNDKLQI